MKHVVEHKNRGRERKGKEGKGREKGLHIIIYIRA